MGRLLLSTVSVATAVPAATTLGLVGLAAPALLDMGRGKNVRVFAMRAFVQGTPAGAGLAQVAILELHPRLVWADQAGTPIQTLTVATDFIATGPAASPTLPQNGNSIFACTIRDYLIRWDDQFIGLANPAKAGIDLIGTVINNDAALPHNIQVGVSALVEVVADG